MLLGWIATPAERGRDGAEVLVTLTGPDRQFGLSLGQTPSFVETPAEPDVTLTLPAEAWLRLATGRLRPEHTPDSVAVTGDLSLDDLRRVFPGY